MNTGNTKLANFYSKDDSGIVVKECELSFSKKYGLCYREGTSDKKMLGEGSLDYKLLNCKDKIVMDCGANIGGFVRKACNDSAKEVYCYEPEQFNVLVLHENVNLLRNKYNTKINVIEAALISTDDESITFNVNGNKTSACSGSVNKTINSTSITVNAVNFWNELERIKPQIIKMDIEGGEYDILTKEFPDYVEEVAIELHGWRNESHKAMNAYIESIQSNKNYEIASLKRITVFRKERLSILHLKRI